MRQKKNKKMCSGTINGCRTELVGDHYRLHKTMYNLTFFQKIQFIHNLLSGDTKRFYFDKVYGIATRLAQAVDMIKNGYNSPVRRNQIETFLSTLRAGCYVPTVIKETKEFQKISRVITKMAREVPSSHREEARGTELLHKAAVGY